MVPLKLIIYGVRRSGNHAITEWLLHCISGGKPRHCISHRLITRVDSCYLNAVNECKSSKELKIDVDFCTQTFRNTFITYEDVPLGFDSVGLSCEFKVVIIRDIFNVAASRYRRLCTQGISWKTKGHYMSIDDGFFNLWINHALAAAEVNHNSGYILISFDHWLSSKEYRDSAAFKLRLKNLDCTSTVSHHGGGSSFPGLHPLPKSRDLKTRVSQVKFPEEIQKRLLADDISFLRRKLGFTATLA